MTPIIKVSAQGKELQSFFTITDYDAWLKTQPDSRRFQIKYYKGLGTSTNAEAKKYFSDL